MHPFETIFIKAGISSCLIMLNLWLLAIWRCLLIFHQNRTTNTLRVPRKERITSHRLIDFHVAKCTLGSFSNAHLSREKPTSEMVFEVVFQPPHGTTTSKSFNIDTNSPCSLFPFTVGPVGDLLTTWPAGVSWCVYSLPCQGRCSNFYGSMSGEVQ